MAEQENPLQKIITKCWDDAAFKERLLADPAATLAAEGVQVPEGVTVNVAVDAEDVRTLVIPLPPTAGLSDAELHQVAGGSESCAILIADAQSSFKSMDTFSKLFERRKYCVLE